MADVHGLIQGMVTLADLMGTLMGGMPGIEAHESDAVQREDGSSLLDGAMPLERLRELLGTAAEFPEEASGARQTLAGLVLHQQGRVSTPAEYFVWDSHRFEVVDMDRNRWSGCWCHRSRAPTRDRTRLHLGCARANGYNTPVKQARQPLADV